MPTFAYRAKRGPDETTDGRIAAESLQAAISKLETQGLSPIWIREFHPRLPRAVWRFRRRGVPSRDVTVFSRQMAGLLKAGVPILKAIATIRDQTEEDSFREVLSQVLTDVRDGRLVSESLARHPSVFPEIYVNMVKSGESAGVLDEILMRLAESREAEDELRGRVLSAMAYPALVLTVGMVSVFVILALFLPRIMHLFEGTTGALPLPTRIVLAASDVLSKAWPWLVLAVVLAGFGVRRYLATAGGRLQCDRVLLRLPVFGRFMRDADIVRFSRTLALLIRAGISIDRAIALSGNTLVNRRLRAAALSVGQSTVRSGASLAAGFGREADFPVFLTSMIAVGEETGRMDESLLDAAAFYQRELDRGLRLVTSLLEPVLILGVGAVVGFIIFAMLLPVFQIGQTLR